MEIAMADSSEKKAISALNTPTDLKSQSVKNITEAINGLIANAFALYLKIKNFHWHLSGPNFRDFHIMLDEQAEQIYNTIEPLAERVGKLGRRFG
jgi:starvation-inducible DNA-binding protein